MAVFANLNEQVEDRIATITLKRPDCLNSYDLEMLSQLQEVITRVSEREDIRVVILTGSGTAFSTGVRIRFIMSELEADNVRSLKRLTETGRETLQLLRRLPQFTIASINGLAVDGGFNLALCCDYTIAVQPALFGYPFIQLGLSPDVGTSSLIGPTMGSEPTLRFLLSGRLFTAEETLRSGIVQEVVPATELVRRTLRLASWASQLPPVVVRGVKRNLQRTFPLGSSLDGEVEARVRSLLSEDFREGTEAFLANRRGRFHGR